MVDITKSNFDEHFASIETAIAEADFIALDTEFTGLLIDNENKNSLFDTCAERYTKLRESATQFTICQIGLSAFKKDPEENKYVSSTYNFYLFPSSFFPIDVRFSCQASSFDFLRRYEFNFNSWVYEGLPYVNESQEEVIRKFLQSRDMFKGLERNLDEKVIQSVCSDIAEWIIQGQEGDIFKIEMNKDMKTIKDYVWHIELRKRFPNIWTETIDKENIKMIQIEKMSIEKRRNLEECDAKERDESFLKSHLGFSRVFKLLTSHKKPLVGHNMLLDLLLVYDKFYRPLPEKFEDFKNGLHELFPVIFDTKHISAKLRKPLQDSTLLKKTFLIELYNQLESTKGQQYVIHSPSIVHSEEDSRYNTDSDFIHQAGYDAYLCGYVFLRLSHIVTFQDFKSTEVAPCTFRRYLQEMGDYKNNINVIRAACNYFNIADKDPKPIKPKVLFVKSLQPSYRLDAKQLAQWFSPYGAVDIKLDGSKRALVATGNYYSAKEILTAFSKHDKIYVTRYNMWKHSRLVWNCVWAGAIASGGLCLWVLFSSRKEK